MEQKLVSIVLPTYNGEKFIRESIESILNQTYKNFELIIVNDCSCDNTLSILQEYEKKDSRIKIITNEINLKLPASLNKGFEMASGDYYTWTSDDNLYKINALEYMVNYLNENANIDLISCCMDIIDEEGNFLTSYNLSLPNRNILQLTKRCNIGACFLYRKQIALKTGKYSTEMFCAEDYDYWCRIALKGNIAYSDENLYLYRCNSYSLTASKQETIMEKTLLIRLKYTLPILNKLEINNLKKVWILCSYYRETDELKWLKISLPINISITFLLGIFYFLCNFIFHKSKSEDNKFFKILGFKFVIKRKNL